MDFKNLTDVIESAIPIVVFIAMLGVGMTMSVDSLIAVLRRPRLLAFATITQAFALPLAAALLFVVGQVDVLVGFAVLLIAASPAGGLSNIYTYLARGNVSLSVCMTFASSLLCFVNIPIVLTVYGAMAGRDGLSADLPALGLAVQLFVMIALPISIGLAIKHLWPRLTQAAEPFMQLLVVCFIGLLLFAVIYGQWETILTHGADVMLASLYLVSASIGIGLLTAIVLTRTAWDRSAIAFEFAVRNQPVAIAVGVTSFDSMQFAAIAGVYVVFETLLVLALVLLFRARLIN